MRDFREPAGASAENAYEEMLRQWGITPRPEDKLSERNLDEIRDAAMMARAARRRRASHFGATNNSRFR